MISLKRRRKSKDTMDVFCKYVEGIKFQSCNSVIKVSDRRRQCCRIQNEEEGEQMSPAIKINVGALLN